MIGGAQSIDELAERVLTRTPGAVHADGGITEQIASQVSKVSSSADRLRVLVAFATASDGHTDAELEQILERPRPTPGNRRGDLRAWGLVRKAYKTRPHPVTGNPCQVHVITPAGLAVVAHLGGTQAALRIAAQS